MDETDTPALENLLQEIINIAVKKDKTESLDSSVPACPKEMLKSQVETEANSKKLEEMRENCMKLAEQNQKLIEKNNQLKVECEPNHFSISIFIFFTLAKAENVRIEGARLAQQIANECCICLEETSGERKIAALIPCGHTVCEECSPNMLGQPCPYCRLICTSRIIVQGIYA